jgi:hypothetical protein
VKSGRVALIISTQLCPDLFFIYLDAPFINNCLTGLVEFNSSTDLIAKCSGVKPKLSWISKFGLSANIYDSANSDRE